MNIFISIFTVIFATSAFAAKEGTCSNFAKQGAIAKYHASVGAVQGSDGIGYRIVEKLKAKKPFHNYVVEISDNNEDGETWDIQYFVMTKLVDGKCKVLKTNKLENPEDAKKPAVLKVTSFEDFTDSSMDLDEAKVFDVDVAFVEHRDNYIDFRAFDDDGETVPYICYEGSRKGAEEIVNAVLDVNTADSFILSSKMTFEGDLLVHEGTYTEGSGDFTMQLSFAIDKCR